MIQLLHTPEGVRDYYNEENARKLNVCGKIRSVFSLFGYQEIQTPTFEYFDIFNAERGTVSSRDMYKLFDRDGETLVLRPDFTPAIARCAAKYFGSERVPVRLSYLGNTYVNNNSLRGQLKESMQAGIELVGDDSLDANAEVITLLVQALKACGLARFQIEIGDVRYFRGFLDAAGISEEVREELRASIENKNHFGLEEILMRHQIDGSLAKVLVELPQMFGDPEEILKKAGELASNPVSLHAISRMETLYRKLQTCGVGEYISFDLGMLGAKDYYTGVIFKGYTYGTGDCIAAGGRYDHLLTQFGKDAPSIGFGISVDTLLQAMSRQEIAVPGRSETTLILYPRASYDTAMARTLALRSEGRPVIAMRMEEMKPEEYVEYCLDNRITEVLVMNEKGDVSSFTPDSESGTLIPRASEE